ncbi:hypothetical protein BpHYR1_010040 [Brachionus plicatilis]|uniref:Uncharacterized protein n=1 Tax=Brachionus plicatilis TaxID=10195 RepID=A0A3M7R9U4_BRAPC|nr:hypothetical protein BpHYR1_010040 [Brachionus plicatilis]
MESQKSSENNKTFLNYLIQKYKQQNEQKDQANSVKTVNAIDLDAKSNAKDNQPEKSEQLCVNISEATLVDKIKAENDSQSACASTDNIQKHQTLIPIQIPFQQLQTPNLKLNPNQPIKLSPSLNSHLTSQKTPKLLIPASKTNNNPQKLIILPSNSNANSNLKILTTTQLNQKIVLNVPSVTKTVDTSKRKFCETNVKTSVSNSNLVCLKLDNFNDESNSSTSSKNGFYDLNGSNTQGAISNLIKTNSNSNLTSAD